MDDMFRITKVKRTKCEASMIYKVRYKRALHALTQLFDNLAVKCALFLRPLLAWSTDFRTVPCEAVYINNDRTA